jgi:hypothetical protein
MNESTLPILYMSTRRLDRSRSERVTSREYSLQPQFHFLNAEHIAICPDEVNVNF